MIDKFTTMIRLKGLDITIDDSAVAELYADPDLMERVIQNLLTNALQHTDQGGITVAANRSDDGDHHCQCGRYGQGHTPKGPRPDFPQIHAGH